jgi:CRISPR-associated protein Cmr5
MARTLDQQRAAYAWDAASKGVAQAGEYVKLAKGAPALIMSSGLMPTLAFHRSKGDAHEALLDDVVRWVALRVWNHSLQPKQGLQAFGQFMEGLQQADSPTYLRATNEALEILKWIRQFVDAVPQGGGGNG